MVAELVYAGHSIRDIAGYDDTFLRHIVFRKRDKYGGLVRATSELPDGVDVDENGQRVVRKPVSFSDMFRSVKKFQGVEEQQIDSDWEKYLESNPKLKERIERAKRQRESGAGANGRSRHQGGGGSPTKDGQPLRRER